MPVSDEHIVIGQTTDPADFAFCAKLMSHNDPWITLGIDEEQCAKAFEGSFREVFVLKKQGRNCRFFHRPAAGDV